MIPGKGDLHDYWRDISTDGDFLGPPPSYTLIRDSILRLFHRMMAHNIAGRSQALEKVTVIDLFYLRGLDVGSIIDMAELVRLHIYVQLDDTWAWVAIGPERQPDAVAGAPAVAKDALAIDEGVTYTPYSQTHMSYQRCIRQRTGEASTSAAQQDPQQPDP
ncbi:hypothetical protein Tco_1488647 [Tanacetum coccineum]